MSENGMRPARRTGLAGEVVESIRQGIFDGVFKVGDRLGEVELARQLDVSRGPVREALLTLRAEGLVDMELHRGASVVRLSPRDVFELTTLRINLETFAIERACEVSTTDDHRDLAVVIEEMSRAVDAGDVNKVTQLDVRFHDGIYTAARHERLTIAWGTIRSQMLLFLLSRAAANTDYLSIAIAEHSLLLQLIESGDADAARAELTQHALGAYERLVRSFPAEERATFPPLTGHVAGRELSSARVDA